MKKYGFYLRYGKRWFDVVVALFALVLLSPLLFLLAGLVRVFLGKPVLFRQTRPGRDGKLFGLVKFRSMTDARGPDGALLPDNLRLTRFGRFLRGSSLDELPELFNILRGQMSLVGPRPLLPQYLPYYRPRERLRHDVLPGLTGWAQIRGRNQLAWDDRLELDAWYVEHCSFLLDLRIMAETVVKVLRRSDVFNEAILPLHEVRRHDEKRPMLYLSPPHMGPDELGLIQEAFRSNWIAPLGPHVDAFEREFAAHLGIGHAAALSSGTAALHLALRLLEIQPGDEVICPSLTFCASATPILLEKARPVFLDSEASTWNLDPQLLEEELAESARRGRLPRAVIVVDLYGQCADYDALDSICTRYDVPIIEDAAEALGARWRGRPAGRFGRLAAFSFNGNKIITTSGGGMLVAEEARLIDQARFLATQARDPAPHYQHSQLGFNYRLSNLLAAVGRGQLRVLEERVNARRRVNALYQERLGDVPGLTFMPEHPHSRASRWLTCVLIDADLFGATPEEVRLALTAERIEARPVWKPLHLQPLFASCRHRTTGVAEDLFARGLCLPSGSNMQTADIERVVRLVLAARRKKPEIAFSST